MLLAVAVVAWLVYWMYRNGELTRAANAMRPRLSRWLLVGASGLLALNGLRGGNWIEILVGIVAALGFAYVQAAAKPPAAETAARAVLGLDSRATAADVQAAWRRRISEAHPDRGGTADHAARVTAARDLLLARLES